MSKQGAGGGGFGSKQHVETGYRTGRGATKQIPAGVAQAGQAQGSHVMTGTESGSGDTGYHGVKPDAGVLPGLGTVPLGNQVASTT